MSSFGGTVKLTGESEYKKALADISSNLKVLNSEMKVVTSQYDKNDTSVENLSSQSTVLNKKLEEQQKKVNVLSNALEESKKETGENSDTTKKWQIELNNAQADLNKLNRELDENSSALEEATKQEDELERQNKSTNSGLKGLAKTLLECGAGSKSLGKEIKGELSNNFENLKTNVGENVNKVKTFASGVSDVVGNMKTMGVVAGLSVAALKLFKDEMEETGDETEETGKEEEKTAEKTLQLGDIIKANLISEGIVAGISAIGDAIKGVGEKFGAFLELGESTKETTATMDRLYGSFEQAGLSAEEAIESVYGLTGVLGDMDKGAEASNLIAKMSKDMTDVEANTRILTGVFAEFGDSIPTEGLAEGMQATAKMGSVQGVLADALEWQGVNLDDYNARLESMTSEEERAAYIQKTLTDIYGESADAYRENNKALIESNEAQLRYEDHLAEMGKLAMPLQTNIKNMSTYLMQGFMPALEGVMPSVQGLSGAFTDLIKAVTRGDEGGIETAIAMVTDSITEIVISIEKALPQVVELVQNLFGVVIQLMVDNLPFIVEQGMGLLTSLISGIINAIPQLIPTVLKVLQTILNTIIGNLPMILEMGIQMLVSLADGIASALPDLIPLAINAVLNLVDTLLDNLDLIIDTGINLLFALIDGILEALPDLMDKIPEIIDKLVDAIFNNFPKILDAGIEIIIALAEGLVKAIPKLLEKLPQIIGKICRGLIDAIPQLIKAGGELLAGLFKGLLNPTAIWNAVKGLFNGIIGGIKELFGIHSPSTVFADVVGKNLALGLGEGFDETMGDVTEEMANAIPTEFDAEIGTNINMTSGRTQMSQYDMMVSAFKQALTEVKVVMDDREMGGFVTNTIERVVYA